MIENGAPLRTLRIRSGLSQRELAELLGFRSDSPTFRHERSKATPDLRAAIAYEIIFHVPISTQFQGIYRVIEPQVEDRILRLRKRLEEQAGRVPNAARDARKLEFFWERENTD